MEYSVVRDSKQHNAFGIELMALHSQNASVEYTT